MRNRRIKFGFVLAMALLVLIIGSSSFVQIGFGSTWATPGSTASQAGAAQRSSVNSHPANGTSSGPPPPGSLPTMAFYNSSNHDFQQPSGPGESSINSVPYAGVEGYQTHGSSARIWEVYTDMDVVGSSYLGSSTVSGGLNLHVPDSHYSIDYLVQFYSYVTSGGHASVSWAFYSACYDTGNGCGPAYNNCTFPNCPVSDVLIASGSQQNIGLAGDNIELLVYWDINSCGSTPCGWVLDYRDQANNPSYWTVKTLYPSGNYATMLRWSEVGEISTQLNPPGEAYSFQVGFTMSSIPTNSNWEVYAQNTKYVPNGTTYNTFTYLNHAETLSNGTYGYYCFWKEVWVVSDYDAQLHGVSVSGAGSSSTNDIYAWYSGTNSAGGVQLW